MSLTSSQLEDALCAEQPPAIAWQSSTTAAAMLLQTMHRLSGT
jgi:hypothetical protein